MSDLLPGLADGLIASCREYLQASADLPADEIPDEEVIARTKITLVWRHCVQLPGSWGKRFSRDLAGYPADQRLSAAQLIWVDRLWLRYRRQLREVPTVKWPMGLPRPPKDLPGEARS